MKCGNKLYKGKEVPINAKIEEHQGRECYLSGLDYEFKYVKFIDTGEIIKYRIRK
jgi:hypothetical protein